MNNENELNAGGQSGINNPAEAPKSNPPEFAT